MHSALRIRSANTSPGSAGHGRCHPQLAVALVASIFGGVTGLVVDLAAQAPHPPSNVRILRDGVVAAVGNVATASRTLTIRGE
jgi:hypothetical protein